MNEEAFARDYREYIRRSSLGSKRRNGLDLYRDEYMPRTNYWGTSEIETKVVPEPTNSVTVSLTSECQKKAVKLLSSSEVLCFKVCLQDQYWSAPPEYVLEVIPRTQLSKYRDLCTTSFLYYHRDREVLELISTNSMSSIQTKVNARDAIVLIGNMMRDGLLYDPVTEKL